MLQILIHYGLHLMVPGLIAYVFFRRNWKKAWIIMVLTMVIDLDHLLSNPIFDPNRCSINFHPLHSNIAVGGYVLLFFFRRTRIIAVGLLFHLFTDYIDCLWMN